MMKKAALMAVFFNETAVTFDQAPFRNDFLRCVAANDNEYKTQLTRSAA